jgi:chain length determinant protein tyrosine kinase EpsG
VTPSKFVKQRAPTAPSQVDARLGELLHEDGTLTEQDIKEILAVQRDCGERFGEVASRLGLVREQDLRRALARQAIFPLVVPGESDLSPLIVAAYQPNSERAEELRTVRSKIVLRWLDRGKKTLAVIEANPNNGCNVLAANLAVTFAQLGERTLLIDANLRAPVQHALFGLKPHFGLVDFIRGRESLENSITGVPDFSCLSVMCAGARPPNPQEMLGRVSFGYLMESAPTKYDVVIVDTPPFLRCADAQLVAARARGAVISTKRHDARLADILRVKAQLESDEVVLLGAVIDG